MAQMTQEMYGAEGRIDNKTCYRSKGKTVRSVPRGKKSSFKKRKNIDKTVNLTLKTALETQKSRKKSRKNMPNIKKFRFFVSFFLLNS